jgi:Domain of unknown function (DUF4440)
MKLIEAERALQQAQRDGDFLALDGLLHSRCVGVFLDGAVFGKAEDLEAHRSGAVRITKLIEEELSVEEAGPVGVTRLVAWVEATVAGTPAPGARLRYTRLWSRDTGTWQVVAAALAPLNSGS